MQDAVARYFEEEDRFAEAVKRGEAAFERGEFLTQEQVGERLRSCVAADSFHIGAGTQIQVTASVGVASLERPTDTPEALIKRADNALYAAKRQGRNRVVGDAA